MNLGVDLGNVNIHTSTELLIENRLAKDEILYENTELNKIEYEGQKYVLGAGEFQTNFIKAEKKDILVSLFTSIALSTKETINQVVLGLPVQQYKPDKDKLEELVNSNRIKDIKINGVDRRIIITNCEVFPEGLATYYSLDDEIKQEIGNRDIIFIDIGGRTTNICLYSIVDGKRKLVKFKTIPAGTLNIYSDFIGAINDKHGLECLKEEAPDILKKGLWVDGEKVKLKFTMPIFEKYLGRVMGELRLNYPIRTAQCILCGGGGILLNGMFRKEIKSLIVVKDIWSNAKGFAKVGEKLWR